MEGDAGKRGGPEVAVLTGVAWQGTGSPGKKEDQTLGKGAWFKAASPSECGTRDHLQSHLGGVHPSPGKRDGDVMLFGAVVRIK